MPRKINVSGATLPRIAKTGKTLKKIDPKILAEALGAKVVSTSAVKAHGPVSLFALRQYLLENLHSSGGRPGLESHARRQKIPLTDEIWLALTGLASILRADGISISPGQMASALIRQSLAQLNALPLHHVPRRKAA